MIDPLTLIVLGFFIIVSIIDWKFKAVPSVLMSGMMLVVAVVNLVNMPYAIICYLLARLIRDFDRRFGIADIKSTIIIGFMISSVEQFMIFTIMLLGIGVAYTFFMRQVFYKHGSFPYLPVYLITYTLLLVGGFL